MKNKSFVIGAIVLIIAGFALASFLMKPKEVSTAPAAWVLETLVRPSTYIKGPADAKVTIVEFLDPECEACRAMHPVVKQIMTEYAGKVRVAYRYLPLHGNSVYASAILEEARAQDKFEEALDVLFEKQPEWGDHHNPRPDLIAGYVSALGVDAKSLDKEIVMAKYKSKIDSDKEDAGRVMAQGTPTFFVNGRMVFELGYEPIKAAVDRALAESDQ